MPERITLELPQPDRAAGRSASGHLCDLVREISALRLGRAKSVPLPEASRGCPQLLSVTGPSPTVFMTGAKGRRRCAARRCAGHLDGLNPPGGTDREDIRDIAPGLDAVAPLWVTSITHSPLPC